MQRHFFQLLLGLAMVAFDSYSAIALDHSSIIIAQYSKQPASQNTQPNLFQQLNLTPKQQNKIKQIRSRYQGQITQLKKNVQLAQQQLAVMMAGTDSAAIMRDKYREIAQFRQQLGQLHFESMLAIREVLTPDQRQTFAEIIETRKQ